MSTEVQLEPLGLHVAANHAYNLALIKSRLNTGIRTNHNFMGAPYLAGKPGLGKTAILKKIFTKNNWGLIPCHLPLKPQEEFTGIPDMIRQKNEIYGKEILTTQWSLPDLVGEAYAEQDRIMNWARPLIAKKELPSDFYPRVAILFDDMHLCGAQHNAILFELLTEDKIKDFPFPANTSYILAGNHKSSVSGHKTTFGAVMNRIVMLPCVITVNEWINGYALPEGVHPAITSFFNDANRGQFLHEEEIPNDPWASPRSWDTLSQILLYYDENNISLNPGELESIVSGAIGNRAATEFIFYYKLYSKFDMKSEFKLKHKIKIPDGLVEGCPYTYAATFYYLKNYKTQIGIDKYEINEDICISFAYIVNALIEKHMDLLSSMAVVLRTSDNGDAFTALGKYIKKIPGREGGLNDIFKKLLQIKSKEYAK